MTAETESHQRLFRVGIVVEGPTDLLVLKSIILQLLSGQRVQFRRIHPDEVMVSPFGNGWRGVQRWCKEYGPTLESFMHAVTSDVLDILVIHVDGSVANESEINVGCPCPPARATADAMRNVVYKDWLQRVPPPPFIVLATPMVDTETWVVSAVGSAGKTLCECDSKLWKTLVKKKLLKVKDGKLKKNQNEYRPLADRVGAQLAHIRKECLEAERFCQDFSIATLSGMHVKSNAPLNLPDGAAQ